MSHIKKKVQQEETHQNPNSQDQQQQQKLIEYHNDIIQQNFQQNQGLDEEKFLRQYLQSCAMAIYRILGVRDKGNLLFQEILNQTTQLFNQQLYQDPTITHQQSSSKGQMDVEQFVESNNNSQMTNHSQACQPYNNNNDFHSKNQIQTQTYKQMSLQTQQEIQYYVYEDLNNLMEILADVKQTLLHFKNNYKHPYIPLSLNRLIQQVNLSNMIHFDCTQRYKNKDEQYFYQKEKDNAKQLYKQLLNEMQLPNVKEIEFYLQNWEQNFGQVNQIKQLPLLETAGEGQFNEKVVQQVFGGIQHVDQKKSQINKGQYMKLGIDQIKHNIKQREIRAEGLLKQNFPKTK